MRIPRSPWRNGLRPVVIFHRRQRPPRDVPADPLHHGGVKHHPKQQPAVQKNQPETRRTPRLHPNRRCKKDREKSRFKQKRVPLQRKKSLPHVHQRQIRQPQADKTKQRRNPDGGADAHRDPDGDHPMNRAIRGIKPEQCGIQNKRSCPRHVRRQMQQIRRRKNPRRPNEPINLPAQREKRAKVNDRQQAEVNRADTDVIGRSWIAAEAEMAVEFVDPIAMSRNKRVNSFAHRPKERNVQISKQKKWISPGEGKRAKDRVRRCRVHAIRLKQMHRFLERFSRHLRISRRSGLQRLILNRVPGEILPARNPPAAERAVAVIDKRRAGH